MPIAHKLRKDPPRTNAEPWQFARTRCRIESSRRMVRGEFLDPFMIHELFPTPTETAFGSHPCCVVSISYEKRRPLYGRIVLESK